MLNLIPPNCGRLLAVTGLFSWDGGDGCFLFGSFYFLPVEGNLPPSIRSFLSWTVRSQHFRWLIQSQSVNNSMVPPSLPHVFLQLCSTYCIWKKKSQFTNKRMLIPSLTSFPQSLSNQMIVCFASLYAVLISQISDAKNAQQNGERVRADRSACVCPLCSKRWVNKGKKKSKQARIQQRSRSFASSGVVITMEADTFPLLIWWDEDSSGGKVAWQYSGGESHVEVRRCD